MNHFPSCDLPIFVKKKSIRSDQILVPATKIKDQPIKNQIGQSLQLVPSCKHHRGLVPATKSYTYRHDWSLSCIHNTDVHSTIFWAERDGFTQATIDAVISNFIVCHPVMMNRTPSSEIFWRYVQHRNRYKFWGGTSIVRRYYKDNFIFILMSVVFFSLFTIVTGLWKRRSSTWCLDAILQVQAHLNMASTCLFAKQIKRI